MSDSQLAASVLALLDGTADTFLVCAGAGAVVAQKTAAEVKTLLSLQNVDNTSDTSKPVSTAQATANGLRVLKAGDTMTGPLVNSTNGAASTPPVLMSGTWFTGGSATTTKPQFLIEPSGTTSNQWSTSGTGLGINAPSGFSGNLIDCQIGATNLMRLTSAGTLSAAMVSSSTITATGYFTTPGFGVMIGYISALSVRIGSTGGIAWAQSTNGADTLDFAISRNAAGVGQVGTAIGNASGSLLLTNITASGLMCAGVYTFATVPSASSNTGKFLRISDRSQKHAYSDGTNWRFFGDDAIIT